MELPILLYQLL